MNKYVEGLNPFGDYPVSPCSISIPTPANSSPAEVVETSITPRDFRNALYEHMVANGVPTETASTIAGEAEIYADGYDAFQQHGVEFAARQMGFQLTSPKFGGEHAEDVT